MTVNGGFTGGFAVACTILSCDLILGRWVALEGVERAGQSKYGALAVSVGDG